MSLIDGKLNQTILYKRRTGVSDTGRPLYEPPVSVPCRLEDDRRLVRNEQGQEVVSESVLFTDFRVYPQDAFEVDGKDIRVIQVSNKVGLNGQFDHCEVRL